ncbi:MULTISPECIES: sensor domain-containing diguanylate cyclase [Exiguobacterium]|uniref:sensor domain-containing diguanylate cyclase n=1 Tax=Exiguobacterium TaxID=33986 RepID=UPI000A607517|nr:MULTISPECIES: sensor domain-containing diguanylate cyclase [Exiguobacterium]HCD58011.1 GGDEF domain-containing protein [Exiguobacterium sp.]
MRPTLPIVYLLTSYGLILLVSGTPFVPPVAVLSTLLGVTFVAVKARRWFFPKHSERSVGIAILLFASGLWINFILTFFPHPPEVDSAANLTLTAFLALTAIAFARLIDWSSIRHARLLYIDGVLLFGMVFVFGYTVILRHLPTFARSDIEFVAMLGYSISFIAQLFFFLILYATGLRGPTHKRLIRAMMLFIVANLGYYTFFIRNELTFAACFFPLYAVSLFELAVYFRDVPPKQPARDRLGRSYLPYISLLVLLAGVTFLSIAQDVYFPTLIVLFSLFMFRQFFSERLNRKLLTELETFEVDLTHRIDRHTAQLELRKEEYRRLFLAHPQPIIRLDGNGHEKAMNPAAERYFPHGYVPDALVEQLNAAFLNLETGEKQLLMRPIDGRTFEVTLIPIPGEADLYVILSDLTEALSQEKWLQELGYHDVLSALPNRRYFEDYLGPQLATLTEGSLLFIDLDGFKQINDRYGHDAGDYVLQETARRLQLDLTHEDLAARLGGDEFIVFLARSRAETITYAENVLLRLNDPFFFDATAMQVTPSIGIARYPDDGRTTSLLLIRADEAMYTVKQEEKNAYRFK